MQKSATLLGQEFGLSGEEMNRVLVKLGFLTGDPGNYSLTEKAIPFAIEKDFHRGCGGYSWYNRYWTTRTFDDSILDELDVTDELISEVREDLSAYRAAKKALRMTVEEIEAARQAEAAVEKATECAAEDITNADIISVVSDDDDSAELISKLKKTGTIGLAIVAGIGVVYGIYKAYPHVKAWWNGRKNKEKNMEEQNENLAEEGEEETDTPV